MVSQALGTFNNSTALPVRAPALNPGSLAALYDQVGSYAYALAVRMLGDRGAAADIVEAVFLEHWRSAEVSGDPQALLLGAVHRHCATWRSRDGNGAQVAPGSPRHDGPMERRTGPASIVEPQGGASRQRATTGLADDQYQALTLAYFDGLNCSQIADALALPPTSARQLLRRGLEALAAVMAPTAQA